jgi:hypothetical protein
MLTDHFKKCMLTEEQTIEGMSHCLQFGNNKSIQWQAEASELNELNFKPENIINR